MEKLPVELWDQIFSLVPGPTIARYCRVSQIWKRRLDSDEVWKKRTIKSFPVIQSIVRIGSWKATYAKLYHQEIMLRQGPPPLKKVPARFVFFAAASISFIFGVSCMVAPTGYFMAFLESPAPLLLSWAFTRVVRFAGENYDVRSSITILSLYYQVATWLSAALIGYQATRARSFTPDACHNALLYRHLSNCFGTALSSFSGLNNRALPEVRLLFLLLTWYSMRAGSMVRLWLCVAALLNTRTVPVMRMLPIYFFPSRLVVYAAVVLKLTTSRVSDPWTVIIVNFVAENVFLWYNALARPRRR